jgi:hypothetical protein
MLPRVAERRLLLPQTSWTLERERERERDKGRVYLTEIETAGQLYKEPVTSQQ